MRNWNQAALKSLIVPGGIVLLAAVALMYSGWLNLPSPALSFLYYCALGLGVLLGLRFHSSRIVLSLIVIFLAQQGVSLSIAQPPFVLATVTAAALLVPTNFILIALMNERGFTRESLVPSLLFLFLQCLTVTVFCGAAPRAKSLSPIFHIPQSALIVAAAAFIFLFVRFCMTRKPFDSALLWSLCSVLLALRCAGIGRTSMTYWSTAVCILGASIVENSYLLAYHDELTGLPSRRAFNDALLRLKEPYSIAVADIDHFKRCNDTYGHDTGDQVLRLVAANLARVTGGGEAYRCGGEEFTILFPGKTTAEVVEHLERLRSAVETAEFRMRGDDRRQAPRGPERRNQRNGTRARKGDAIRRLATERAAEVLSVTISIGVASATRDKSSPDAIVQAADKALYRAKENGRNRVETSSSGRRSRVKAAGIA